MNTSHDERHEALLQALLARDRTREDPEVVRRLAECEHCRERIDELETVVGALDDIESDMRAILSTPRSSAQATIEARIRPTLERLRDEDQPRSREHPSKAPRRWPWLVLAAAVLLAGFFIVRSQGPKVRPIDELLGDKIVLVSPGEFLGPDDIFECRYEAPPGTHFEFHVDDMNGNPILIAPQGEPRWKPTPKERARIPQHFRWRVEAIDIVDGRALPKSETRSSSLSP
jgi:hypothetical protein